MKQEIINNKILKVLGLALMLSLGYGQKVQAQSIWDTEDKKDGEDFEKDENLGEFDFNSSSDADEEGAGNFYGAGGISSNRSIDFGHLGGNAPQYRVRKGNSAYGLEENGIGNVQNLDIEVHKHLNGQNSNLYIGGSNGGATGNNTNSSANGTINGYGTSAGGQVKIKEYGNGSPGNPGNPDAPIDGGLSILIGAGLAYGTKKLRKKQN